MNSLTPCSHNLIDRSIARVRWHCSLVLLLPASVLLAGANVFATTNHPPMVSWITDQAITVANNNQFAPAFFRAWDKETDPLPSPTPIIENDTSNPNFIVPRSVHIGTCNPVSDPGCPPDHGYKVTFDPLTHGDGAATIVIKATDTGGNETQEFFHPA